MEKNESVIGLGLVLAILLGVVIVGGGAYYLGKNKGENKEINNQDQNLQPVNQDQQVVENNKKVNTQSKLTIYNSNTYGYSVGYSGIDSKNVYITGDGKIINLFSNQSNVDTISIIDLATFLPSPDSVYKGTVTFGNNQYKKFKNNTIPRSTTYLISGLKNNKSILINVENDSDNPNYLDLSSLRIDTLNSTEESATEIFKDQPGEIKSIKEDGLNQWILSVDLLTRNTNWLPGVDSSGPFFLNQNTKIRNLKLTNQTKAYDCENKIVSNSEFIKKLQSDQNKNRYFNINGTNITVIYEQCLP